MTDIARGVQLRRCGAPPPIRMVHVGLGAFHRSHQAWYTARAADSAHWGIAAFTGQSLDVAERLNAQGGVYTLIVRGSAADSFETVDSIVAAYPGVDIAAFVAVLGSHDVVVLTLTITEAAYHLDAEGVLDLDDPHVCHDLTILRAVFAEGSALDEVPPLRSALARVLLALEGRRRSGAPPLAIIPCDNLPHNGYLVGQALASLAEMTSAPLRVWLETGISVVSTSVDRITPRMSPEDSDEVFVETGVVDLAPVVTEEFSDWVLAGDFPSGRPAWETAGARFVADIAPWEARKLWMLNGAHSVLAALGTLRGHALVSGAIDDPVCREVVDALWQEAARHLPDVEVTHYAAELIARFRNPRIEHRLVQIATDATTKMRLRIVPVALRERAAGRPAEGCAAAVAAWWLSDTGDAPREGGSNGLDRAVACLDTGLAHDPTFMAAVAAAVDRIRRAVAAEASPGEADRARRPQNSTTLGGRS
ncbi:mannitol dehydrogenase family protein [Microbacterium sp. SSW1-59]|uniref:mannitol dehydrogenase family protein n=1 Tax=Microbacterium xanthum TaxID=3079794 RepID=UPI002AD284D7|nr:mannitol dehydrogenase family protein [Microbacterium sp. SSW1-59]MDZ8201686.1 mannitol dehydrogenase family protein [Microbacterium sp. SSW1-59]